MSDSSDLVRWTNKHFEEMRDHAGLSNWRIGIGLGTLEEGVVAETDLSAVSYRKAHIVFNPLEVKSEGHYLFVLRHELLHVLLSPFTKTMQIALDDIEEAKASLLDNMAVCAQEEAVNAVEFLLDNALPQFVPVLAPAKGKRQARKRVAPKAPKRKSRR